MEIRVQAPRDGMVKKLFVQQGQTVEREQILLEIERASHGTQSHLIHNITVTSNGDPMSGKYFDELEVGMKFKHTLGRTVTEMDNVLFSALTMNTQPLHVNEDFASKTEFGQRLVNGVYTLRTGCWSDRPGTDRRHDHR